MYLRTFIFIIITNETGIYTTETKQSRLLANRHALMLEQMSPLQLTLPKRRSLSMLVADQTAAVQWGVDLMLWAGWHAVVRVARSRCCRWRDVSRQRLSHYGPQLTGAQMQTASQRDRHWGTYNMCTVLCTSCYIIKVQVLSLEGCKQAEIGNVSLWSIARRCPDADSYSAWQTLRNLQRVYIRTVDALILASSNYTWLCIRALAAAEVADHSIDSMVYSLSLHISIPSVDLWYLTILFGQIQIHYSAYCSVQIEYE